MNLARRSKRIVKKQGVTDAILDGMADGVTLFDPEHRLSYFNAAAERMFAGTPGAAEIGKTIEALARTLVDAGDGVVIDGKALSAEEWVAHITRPEGVRYERRLLSGRDVEISYALLADGSLLGIHRDITELKRRQSELERARDDAAAAQRLMNTVLETMTDGVRLYDTDTRLVYQNSAIPAIFGSGAASSELGLSIEEIFRQRIAEAHQASVSGQPIDQLEGRRAQFFNPDGGSYDVQLASGRKMEATIRPVGDGRRLGIFRDVTELKQRQEELERARDEIQDTQLLMDSILGGMTDGVRLFDADRRLIYENAAVRGIYGISSDDSQLGMTIAEILRAQVAGGIPLVIDGKTISVEDVVARMVAPQGSRYERELPNGRHVEFQTRPLSNGRTLSVLRDITELRRQQAEIAAAQKLMEAVLGGMTDGVSLFDGDQRLAYENEAVKEIFGVSRDAWQIGISLSDLLRAQVAAGIPLAVDGKETSVEDMATRLSNAAGSHYERLLPNGRHIEVYLRPLGDGRKLSVLRDITALKRQQADIAATQQLVTTVLDNMTDGVRLFNADERLVYENNAVAEMLGSIANPEMGLPVQDIFRQRIISGAILPSLSSSQDFQHRLEQFRSGQGGGYEVAQPNGKIVEIRFRRAGNGRT